nr:hypothetical protein [Tanacetum cinerariifolium]
SGGSFSKRIQPVLGKGSGHLVGSGVYTLFWEDPRLCALETVKQISIADKFRHASVDSSFLRVPKGRVEVEQFEELGSRLALVQLAQMICGCGPLQVMENSRSIRFTILWTTLY